MSFYDFTVKKQDGKEISLADYKGKLLLIVNTATDCGFTPQYVEMQEIYDECHINGLEILDFPCINLAIRPLAQMKRFILFVPATLASHFRNLPKSM